MPHSSDPFFSYAILIDVLALMWMALLVLAAIYLRMTLNRRAQQEHVFLAIWRPLMLSSLNSSVPADLPSLASSDRMYFLKLWNGLMRSATRNAQDNLIDIAHAIGCERFSRRMLRYGNRAECLLATIALGYLRDQVSRDALVTQTMASDSITSLHAFHALVRINADVTASELTPLMLAREDWPVAQVAAILQSAQSAFMLPLLEATAETRATHLTRTLRLIEALHLTLPHATIVALLQQDNVETVIAALRITNDAGLLAQVRPHLQHSDWRVRLQAAKALGRTGEHADVNRLVPLLADSEWWVRYRTAQALVGMSFFSLSEADMLRNNLSDRFARDMLAQAIAERYA
jgi:HEAT repeat protein